jgi:hypothetical protein
LQSPKSQFKMPPTVPTREAMNIKPADEQGPVLTSRGRAAVLRAVIEQAVADGEQVVLDFDGVETMSPSFADELIAKLDPEALREGHVRLCNLPPSVKSLARYLTANRHRALPAA